jgi:hypothetical protein
MHESPLGEMLQKPIVRFDGMAYNARPNMFSADLGDNGPLGDSLVETP